MNIYLFQIPFLSSSEGIGRVIIREHSSSFIIEDCLCGNDNEWKRRLRFDSNPNLIQSEINLISNEKTDTRMLFIGILLSEIYIYRLVAPDYSILENDYHGIIVACLKTHFLATSKGVLAASHGATAEAPDLPT